MKNTFFILLIPLIFVFCKGKNVDKSESSEVIADEVFMMTNESESVFISEEEHPYTITLDPNKSIDFEAKYAENAKIYTDGVEEDTIAVGCGGLAQDEFAFAGNVELNSKWLAILFPNVEGYNITKVRADIVETKRYETIEHFGRDVTIHSIDPKYNSTDYNDRKPWDYDIAFKGNYQPSDFRYYPENAVSLEDTLRIHKLITEYTESEKSPLRNSGYPKIYLEKLYSFGNNLYAALYFSDTDDETYNYPHLFLIKGDKILLWENCDFELRLNAFSLLGQDYIWTFEQNRHSISNCLYKLNDNDLNIIYSIMQTD